MGDFNSLRALRKNFTFRLLSEFAVNGFFSIFAVQLSCPDGGIGRRAGLKHQWQQCCAGSIPAPGTISNK